MEEKLAKNHGRYRIQTGGIINILKSKRKLRGHFKGSSIIGKGTEAVVAYGTVRRSTDKRTEIMPGSERNKI